MLEWGRNESDDFVFFIRDSVAENGPAYKFLVVGGARLKYKRIMKSETLCKIIAAAIVSVLLPFVAGCGKQGALTKEKVQAVLESIDQALLKKDAPAVIANYASNAVITATVVEGGHTDKTRYDTSSSYGAVLAGSFGSFSDYTLTRTNLVIEISADGKTATTTSTLVETFTFGGKTERAVTHESASLEIIGGKVLVTKSHDDVVVE